MQKLRNFIRLQSPKLTSISTISPTGGMCRTFKRMGVKFTRSREQYMRAKITLWGWSEISLFSVTVYRFVVLYVSGTRLLPHFGVSTDEEFMGVCAAILGARFESVTLFRVKKDLVDCGNK